MPAKIWCGAPKIWREAPDQTVPCPKIWREPQPQTVACPKIWRGAQDQTVPCLKIWREAQDQTVVCLKFWREAQHQTVVCPKFWREAQHQTVVCPKFWRGAENQMVACPKIWRAWAPPPCRDLTTSSSYSSNRLWSSYLRRNQPLPAFSPPLYPPSRRSHSRRSAMGRQPRCVSRSSRRRLSDSK